MPGPLDRGDRPHVIVAGCRHGGLAVARALGPLGYRLTGLTAHPGDFGAASRWFEEVVTCPPPADEDRFVGALVDRAGAWGGALLLETEDAFTTALSHHRDVLSADYHVHAGPWAVVRTFLEKDRTVTLAESAGVAVPLAHRVTGDDDADRVLAAVRLPAIVKPVRSHEFVRAFGTKLWTVGDASELRDALGRTASQGIEVIVQEIVPGPEHLLESVEVYVDRNGRWAAEQYNVKLRQSPPQFGVMRVGRSVSPIDDVRAATERLLSAAGYRGYASAEFKRDPRDGTPKLIEVNVRLPRNGSLMLRSGTNFPHVIHQDLVVGASVTPGALRPATFIDLVADAGNLATRDRRLLREPRAAFGPYLHRRKAYAVMSWADPRPMAVLLRNRLRKATDT